MRRILVALHSVGLSAASLTIHEYCSVEANKYLFDQEFSSGTPENILLGTALIKDLVKFITFDVTLLVLDPTYLKRSVDS